MTNTCILYFWETNLIIIITDTTQEDIIGAVSDILIEDHI